MRLPQWITPIAGFQTATLAVAQGPEDPDSSIGALRATKFSEEFPEMSTLGRWPRQSRREKR